MRTWTVKSWTCVNAVCVRPESEDVPFLRISKRRLLEIGGTLRFGDHRLGPQEEDVIQSTQVVNVVSGDGFEFFLSPGKVLDAQLWTAVKSHWQDIPEVNAKTRRQVSRIWVQHSKCEPRVERERMLAAELVVSSLLPKTTGFSTVPLGMFPARRLWNGDCFTCSDIQIFSCAKFRSTAFTLSWMVHILCCAACVGDGELEPAGHMCLKERVVQVGYQEDRDRLPFANRDRPRRGPNHSADWSHTLTEGERSSFSDWACLLQNRSVTLYGREENGRAQKQSHSAHFAREHPSVHLAGCLAASKTKFRDLPKRRKIMPHSNRWLSHAQSSHRNATV